MWCIYLQSHRRKDFTCSFEGLWLIGVHAELWVMYFFVVKLSADLCRNLVGDLPRTLLSSSVISSRFIRDFVLMYEVILSPKEIPPCRLLFYTMLNRTVKLNIWSIYYKILQVWIGIPKFGIHKLEFRGTRIWNANCLDGTKIANCNRFYRYWKSIIHTFSHCAAVQFP